MSLLVVIHTVEVLLVTSCEVCVRQKNISEKNINHINQSNANNL